MAFGGNADVCEDVGSYGAWQGLLGGSWYLLANFNCTYNCAYNHIRALNGAQKMGVKYSDNC